MKLITWNVNSVRARLDNVLTYLDEQDPDVVCLQETKVEDKLFPRVPFMEMGYHVELNGTKGYAGVATLSKSRPTEVCKGFTEGPADKHRRILNCVIDGVRIYNLYVPNGTSLGSEAFAYKLAWLEQLRAELHIIASPNDDVVLCGDFNIAPTDGDVWDVAAMADSTHVTPEERGALESLIEFGLTDCFRRLCTDPGRFTWFDYRGNSWEQKKGMRIDHVYATKRLAELCSAVVHDFEPRGWDGPSDHVPVVATFDGV